ncbi:uncharacterized protein SAPINGB_P006159 [Magnusiomyces paraingens]|uniref:Exonuclease domain-containing protein n=1 Tax=Magnusiomyces paraingens TaxID=2606893 RepID=A0A5E8C3K2_9ASCO|nr:uncharacterized protein SAPINGB_P006159 [Saprochaete ingens]VVT58344.1 unnamed protein product [Saprochaete ingens]
MNSKKTEPKKRTPSEKALRRLAQESKDEGKKSRKFHKKFPHHRTFTDVVIPTEPATLSNPASPSLPTMMTLPDLTRASGKRRRRSSPTGSLAKSTMQALLSPVSETSSAPSSSSSSSSASISLQHKSKKSSHKKSSKEVLPEAPVRQESPSLYLGSFTLSLNDPVETIEQKEEEEKKEKEEKEAVTKPKRKSKEKSAILHENIKPQFIVEPNTKIASMLRVSDLRDLVLYLLADGRAPSWVGIKQSFAIHRIVSIYVPSLSPSMFNGLNISSAQPQTFESSLGFFHSNFEHAWVVESPGNKHAIFSPTETFLYLMANSHDRSVMKVNQNKNPKSVSPLDLILTLEELMFNRYPVHPDTTGAAIASSQNIEILEPPGEDWVDTKPLDFGAPRVFAIDCEMCETCEGKELTRVTIVGGDGDVVLDELVKPFNQISNYLSQYSGITAKMLDPINTRLSEVQERILSLISSDDIIIGHSLENDLIALKMRHPRVIDTAVAYHSETSIHHKPSLKNLAKSFLKRDIQTSHEGHDSKEDAETCLDLLDLKLKYGATFGHTQVNGKISLADRLSHVSPRDPKLRPVAVVDYGVPNWACSSAQTIVSCTDDDEVIKHSGKAVNGHSFTWARLRELELLSETALSPRRFRKGGPGVSGNSLQNPIDCSVVSQSCERLGERLENLYQSLPANTAVLVWTGHGDKRAMLELNAKRQQYQYEYRTKNWRDITCAWTDHDAQALVAATDVARKGLAFLTVKR